MVWCSTHARHTHGLKSSGRKVLNETSLLFNYFCGGGQESAFNAHQLLAQARYQQA